MTKLSDIDALILCGGLGKRLRELIDDQPKVMAKFGKEPFLNIQLQYLKKQGFQRIILLTGYLADIVEGYYRKNSFGLTIEFSREEKPLGTGGAVKNAEGMIKSDPFYVMNGDCFCHADLREFFDYYIKTNAVSTIVAGRVSNKKDFGSVEMDKNGKILRFLEKNQESGSPYSNAGQYLFNREVLNLMPEGACSLEYDIFPQLTKKDFYGFKVEDEFFDIGTPERFNKAKEILSRA